jgi:uncharacterized protein
MSQPAFTNHLAGEKSPYLLQHVHNPVDWYPWGEEAFSLAKKLDRPIFLSIGYATCHWCHVMEQESFEDAEIARMMNESFVNVKVDREELPEVDSVYMEFAQALMSSAGGWPLNVFLTPELKPFFAVTYLPPKTRRGLIGLDQFLHHIKQIWQSDERSLLVEQANKIVEIFERSSHFIGSELPDAELISASVMQLLELADPVFGGIKGEPKFPLGYQANFLLEYAKKKNESRALFYVELTLNMMGRGGIYDHLGGGFSRYSVDERWMIPHFEKMLYDNAILANTYLEAWKFTEEKNYRVICKEILDYVVREMTAPQGGFYSAEDADSEGHEGRFYTWTPAEIKGVLSADEAALFCHFFNVTEGGNFEGRSVLHSERPIDEFATLLHLDPAIISQQLEEAKRKLFKKREERPRPFKDDKILSGWNGLMIASLAKAGRAFQETAYAEAALKAARFIKEQLWKEKRLFRRFREGEARFPAGLDDYAFLICGCLTLFEEGYGSEWLNWAVEMASILENDFKMPKGAFYQTDGKEPILIRRCEFYDGAEPSGDGVHCENLLRLFQITQEEKYLTQAEDILKAAKNFLEAYPPGAVYHLIALQRYLDIKAATLVIVLDEKQTLKQVISEALSRHFCPHAAVIWKYPEESALAAHADKTLVEGQTTVYLCRQDLCGPALRTKEEIIKAIEAL